MAAAGKESGSIAARLVMEAIKPLVTGAQRLTLALDDTPTKRYGPHVQGAGVHHNPTSGRLPLRLWPRLRRARTPGDSPRVVRGGAAAVVSLVRPGQGSVAAEVRDALINKGYPKAELPSERTMRNILNRMNYCLKRIQKGKPLKKTKETDAIFSHLKEVREAARNDPEVLEISMDTKAKVSLGDYARGEKNQDRRPG